MKIPSLARLATALLLLAALGTGSALALAALHAVPQNGEIRFVSKQMGVPTEGGFKNFRADVVFDPARPEASKARIEVDLASIQLGLPEIETEVNRPLWFDTAKFPTASFVSTSVKPLGGGKYEAIGTLSIKGTVRDVAVPFTLTASGGTSQVAGTIAIKRLDYRIGEKEWADTDTVANEVEIRFRLTLAATPAKTK